MAESERSLAADEARRVAKKNSADGKHHSHSHSKIHRDWLTCFDQVARFRRLPRTSATTTTLTKLNAALMLVWRALG